MNRNNILKTVVVAFVLSCLILPWQYTADKNGENGFHTRKPAYYSLIFIPPSPDQPGENYGVQIDFSRLLIEWAILGAATGLILLLKSPDNK